jgi:Uncharacterized protein conserved in bacteria (DUF2188)
LCVPGALMNKNDRYVVNHPDGWAVKKSYADRASAIFATQREAELRAKEIVHNYGGGEVKIQDRHGQWRDSDTVLRHDPSVPRERKH